VEGGYLTTTDNETIELSDNFTVEMKGWVDTSVSGNLTNKEGSFICYTNADDSSITARIERPAVYTSYTTNDDAAGDVRGLNYWAQTFTTTIGFRISGVRVKLYRTLDAGTLSANITTTSGGDPTTTTLTSGSIEADTISAVSPGDWYYIDLTDYDLSASTKYALVLSAPAGDAGNRVHWRVDNSAATYAGGNLVDTTDAGGSWNTYANADAMFEIITAKPEVEALGVSAGEHTVTISANITDLILSIDGIVTDNCSMHGLSVSDNVSDWLWIEDDVMPYMDYATIDLDGVEVLRYEPARLIDGTTLPDETGTNNAVITWGTNSDITITGGDIMDSNSATSIGTTSAQMQSELAYIGTYAAVYLSFEYGLDTTYGYFTSETSVATEQTFAVTLTGLTPNTTYHFRAIARNGVVFSYGADTTFTTAISTASEGSTTPLIRAVGLFDDYSVTGDLMIIAEIFNTYPPYYPSGIPSEYFQMQLLDTDNTTILAASPLVQWGDRPESIYLNPTSAANITNQAAYQIRVTSISSENLTSASYTIVATDWKGVNKTNLDDFCRGVAINMQLTDGTLYTDPYVESIAGYGLVITGTAGGFFTEGVEGIAQIRPRLFKTSAQKTTLTKHDSDIVYGAGVSLTDRLGASIVADAGTIGGIFGVGGAQVLLMIPMVIVLIGVFFILGETAGVASALGAVALGAIVLSQGAYLTMISVGSVFVLCAVALWFFVRQIFWK